MYISTSSATDNKIKTVEIYNVVGQNVGTRHVVSANEPIDVSELTKGIYFIKILSNDKTFNYKFVKQ